MSIEPNCDSKENDRPKLLKDETLCKSGQACHICTRQLPAPQEKVVGICWNCQVAETPAV